MLILPIAGSITGAPKIAAMRALGRAAAQLPPDSLGRLQVLTETALSVGALL